MTIGIIKETAVAEIMDKWFVQRVIRGKNLSFRYEITNEYLEKQSHRIQRKCKEHNNRQSFLGDYIMHCYLAINKFNATDTEWFAMARDPQNSRIDELSKYVYVTVWQEMKRERMQINGKIISMNGEKVLIKMNPLSLDLSEDNQDGSEGINIVDVLTKESDVFSTAEENEYYNSDFRLWFNANRALILTKNQNNFIANLNKVNLDVDTNEQVRAKIGIARDQINKKLDKITERVVNAYNAQLPRLGSREVMELKQAIALLQPIVSMSVREHDLELINSDIFTYISKNYGELQPFCKLSASEHIAINRCEYDTQLVYKLTDILSDKLKQHQARLDKITAEQNEVEKINEVAKFVRKSKSKLDEKSTKTDDKPDMKVFYMVNRDGYLHEID